MDAQAFDLLQRLEQKVDATFLKIDAINKTLGELPCKVHDTKIGFLQKVVYGAVSIILLAWLVSFSGKATQAENPNQVVKRSIVYEHPQTEPKE